MKVEIIYKLCIIIRISLHRGFKIFRCIEYSKQDGETCETDKFVDVKVVLNGSSVFTV